MIKLNKNFDLHYIFRIANNNDVKRIMKFMKYNWSPKNHILSKNIKFFLYEFGNFNKLNFFIALDKKNNKIYSIQGFIPYSENLYNSHICASITCVDQKCKIPFLGLETMNRMLHLLKPRSYCGIGTNPDTMLPLVKKYFNRYTGKLKHFYLLNKKIKKFNIAKLPKINFNYEKYTNKTLQIFSFKEIKSFDYLEKNFNFKKFPNLPYKSKWYVNKRYFKHPIYKYRFFFIRNNNTKYCSLLVIRKIEYKKTKFIRFVDFIGNIKDFVITREIANYLFNKEKIEYIDFYSARLPKSIINTIKFRLIKHNDKNIVPDYFEPFTKKNVSIFFESSNNKMILFKADADQDRPRLNL